MLGLTRALLYWSLEGSPRKGQKSIISQTLDWEAWVQIRPAIYLLCDCGQVT